jgi:hypothetical protein
MMATRLRSSAGCQSWLVQPCLDQLRVVLHGHRRLQQQLQAAAALTCTSRQGAT